MVHIPLSLNKLSLFFVKPKKVDVTSLKILRDGLNTLILAWARRKKLIKNIYP